MKLSLNAATFEGLPFRRGDANNDGDLNISDASYVLTVLFLGVAETPACAEAADADDSGMLAISDAVVIFNFLFRGGNALPAPFGDCGFDTTPSDLDCESSICVP